jgi:hypothetical protein
MEIFARYLPALDRKWQLSTEGGGMPRWSNKGDRVYFWALAGGVHEVVVRTQGDDLVIVSTRKVFAHDALGVSWAPWFDLSHDETQFLLNRNASSGPRNPLALVLNWTVPLSTH